MRLSWLSPTIVPFLLAANGAVGHTKGVDTALNLCVEQVKKGMPVFDAYYDPETRRVFDNAPSVLYDLSVADEWDDAKYEFRKCMVSQGFSLGAPDYYQPESKR